MVLIPGRNFMHADSIEKKYQEFVKVYGARERSSLFTLMHLRWCLENMSDLPNEAHLIDSLNMTGEAPDFTREKELRIMALSLFILFWVTRDQFPEEGERYLEEIKEYGIATMGYQDDVTITIMHRLFECGALLAKGDEQGSRRALGEFDELTSSYEKKEDSEFIRDFREHAGDRTRAAGIFGKRATVFLGEHADYIERLIKKTSRHVDSLGAGLLESMMKALEKGDVDSLMKMLGEKDSRE